MPADAQPAAFAVEGRIEFLQLRGNRFRVASRIGVSFNRYGIDDVQEQARTREMPEKLMPQPGTLRGSNACGADRALSESSGGSALSSHQMTLPVGFSVRYQAQRVLSAATRNNPRPPLS